MNRGKQSLPNDLLANGTIAELKYLYFLIIKISKFGIEFR